MERGTYNRGGRGGVGRGGRGGGGRGGGDQHQQYHQGGGGGGRGGGRGGGDQHQQGGGWRGGRGGGDQHQHYHHQGGGWRGGRGAGDEHQQYHHQGGGWRGGRGGGDEHQQYHHQGGRRGQVEGGRGGPTGQPPAQQWVNRPGYAPGGTYSRPPTGQGVGPSRTEAGESSGTVGYGRGVGGGAARGGSGKAWVTAPVPDQPPRAPEPLPDVTPDVESLKISEQPRPSPLLGSTDKNLLPLKRPDKGGRNAIGKTNLLVNHFPVKFNPEATIIHYDVDIKPKVPPKGRSGKIPKSDLRMIRGNLFSDASTQFPLSKTAYDGEKNIFSAVELPTGQFTVEYSHGEDMKSRSYIVTIKLVNVLKLCKLKDYFSGNLLSMPRDILQGMDVVMKEIPFRHRVSVGRGFYPKEWYEEDDLGGGIAASRGIQHSLKPTSQGLALCLDYSVLAFRKPLPVLDFLEEHIRGFSRSGDFRRLRRDVMNALEGLKVTVNHRITKQKFSIAGLTEQNTQHLSFDVEDPEGKIPPKKVRLVDYFREKYGKEIMYKDIPCLDLGKNKRKNYVPMEFCIVVEGQRYPKEYLDRNAAQVLKEMSVAPPDYRKNMIYKMVRAEDGPCGGDVIRNFDMQVIKDMTRAEGRVLGPPDLRLGGPSGNMDVVRVDKEKCQWNLVRRSVVDGKPIERWALIDFSSADRYKLIPDNFIHNLRNRCRNLGIRVEDPLVCRFTQMVALSNVNRLRQLFESVVGEANEKRKGRLQIIVCVMSRKDPGYKYLKWISETEIGVVTQCCLSTNANKGNDQYLANLALKINAKLGGSNVELVGRLPRFEGESHVMFVGADVNHPGSRNSTCPSMAAVVATVNWPAANRYAARVCPQDHRTEKILNFGSMCVDLVHSYDQVNKVRPEKIVVFRDGVSEGQFDMVLNEELFDLKRAFRQENYFPTITLVVAQKRHQTRLFPESRRDGGSTGNVPPGTVVDTTIVHPFDFDFYLCSHYGSLGTSKPTHYYVLWDEHEFTSDQLQKLIFDLCFTFARCTKPVSLVPPVYYADLVAYRGRMFQEVVMELQPPPSVASSSSSRASSSSLTLPTTSFDERFYKLHPELENIMFFV